MIDKVGPKQKWSMEEIPWPLSLPFSWLPLVKHNQKEGRSQGALDDVVHGSQPPGTQRQAEKYGQWICKRTVIIMLTPIQGSSLGLQWPGGGRTNWREIITKKLKVALFCLGLGNHWNLGSKPCSATYWLCDHENWTIYPISLSLHL